MLRKTHTNGVFERKKNKKDNNNEMRVPGIGSDLTATILYTVDHRIVKWRNSVVPGMHITYTLYIVSLTG